jgi:hypothetical protein
MNSGYKSRALDLLIKSLQLLTIICWECVHKVSMREIMKHDLFPIEK